MEVIVTSAQRIEKMGETRDGDVCAGREAVNPGIESLKIVGAYGAIRAEGRIDTCLDIRSGDAAVIFKAVSRIVGGADRPHLEALENALRG